jgi:ribosomal protein L24E
VPYLYRTAITINRKPPYIDWANSFDDGGPKLTMELGRRDSIYLVPVAVHQQSLEEVLAEWWQDIFEEELAEWMQGDEDWPAVRTREMFDAWFDAAITDSVIDLAPEEPLTEADVELEDLAVTLRMCAWCERELEEGEGRTMGFNVTDRQRLAHREGRVLALLVRKDRMVTGIVTPAESDEGRRGDDLVFRVCSRACEQPLKKLVPPALRKLLRDI